MINLIHTRCSFLNCCLSVITEQFLFLHTRSSDCASLISDNYVGVLQTYSQGNQQTLQVVQCPLVVWTDRTKSKNELICSIKPQKSSLCYFECFLFKILHSCLSTEDSKKVFPLCFLDEYPLTIESILRPGTHQLLPKDAKCVILFLYACVSFS